MRVAPRSELERIEVELEQLPKLTARQLDERWRELFGTPRPQRLYGPLLIGVLAYRLQQNAFGGIKPATRGLLRQVAGLPTERRSLAGLLGVGSVHAYTAAKGGVISLTRAVAIAYAKNKVRCNVICPGAVDTPMMAHVLHGENQRLRQGYERSHPLGRVGTPEDIAAMALYLASDESSWVTGSVFTIDGGNSAQ